MRYLLTPDEMRLADSRAINEFAIPGAILMENAAHSACDILLDYFEALEYFPERILILCGSGNNGGDGFALARHLNDIFSVTVLWIGSEEKMSHETSVNFNILKKMGMELININDVKAIDDVIFSFDCLIDAMIGVGGTEDLKGKVVELLEMISYSDAIKVAIDAPTGLNTTNGFAHEFTFAADMTITMYAEKTGMYLNKGPKFCGEIITAELGAPAGIIHEISKNSILDNHDISALLPLRKKESSKFDYGKSLIIAGSLDMPGAAALAANACISAGSGLVYLLTPNIHHSLYPEVIPYKVNSSDMGGFSMQSMELADKLASSCNSIAIGPGIGNSEEAIEFARTIIYKYMLSKVIVVDGDGIKAIDPTIQLSNNVVLTPHTGEFSRLTGISREEIEKFPNKYAIEWSEKLGCVIHLKAHPSVTAFSGKAIINPYGNPGMASAGSGDVLTGFIAALSAQGLNVFESAALSSFLHSKCGDKYIENNPALTLRASDLIDNLKYILPAGY